MRTLVKLLIYGDCQHLLTERSDESPNQIEQEIAIAEDFVGIIGGYDRLHFSRIG